MILKIVSEKDSQMANAVSRLRPSHNIKSTLAQYMYNI